jgi:hypothetical protein
VGLKLPILALIPADLNHVHWGSHCRDLVQLAVAA